jgi:hypothetical protein
VSTNEKTMQRQGIVGPFGYPTPFAPTVGPFGAFDPLAAYPTFPPGVPMAVAPVRRVVHPTRFFETHTMTRIPIVHIFPSHTRRVHHNVYEHYCEYPHTASDQCCDHSVDCCCMMPPKPSC